MALDHRQLTTDFKQRYEGTYVRVKFPSKPDKCLFYLAEISQATKFPILTLKNKQLGTIQLNYDTESEIYFDFPPTGLSFYEGQAVLFRRHPTRQWRRGLCSGNASIQSLYQDAFSGIVSLGCPGLTYETLAAAFQSRSLSFTEVRDSLKAGKIVSAPISKTIAIGLNPTTSENPIVWFLDTPIAELVGDTTIRMHEQHFQQEIVDYFAKERSDVRII